MACLSVQGRAARSEQQRAPFRITRAAAAFTPGLLIGTRSSPSSDAPRATKPGSRLRDRNCNNKKLQAFDVLAETPAMLSPGLQFSPTQGAGSGPGFRLSSDS